MYEHMTFEYVMEQLLENVDDSYDKREGSPIWIAISAVAVELCNFFVELDTAYDQTFVDTAEDEFLIRRCAERGITPNEATHVTAKGVFNIDIPIGSRFNLDDYNYTVIEQIANLEYKLKCETPGEEPNSSIGTLIPIEYIEGLTSAELTEILIPGENEDDNESIRIKYFASLDSQAFGGNIADYKEKTNELPGVGGVKVYRAWNGGGTVKLVIINSEFQKPSTTLVNDVQTAIDPIGNQGDGMGLAPIGHVVTVTGIDEMIINIAATFTFESGWSFESTKPYIEEAIDTYLNELSETWEENESLVVRIAQIETRLLNVTGIIDITGTTINDVESNLILPADSIPVRGAVSG